MAGSLTIRPIKPTPMSLPRLSYLSFDPVTEGVGASQVLPYVERLSLSGLAIELHSFERASPPEVVASRLTSAGVGWRAHHFGQEGAVGGLSRILRGALALRGSEMVHARSDLAAAAALLARPPAWIWDMRSFWVDQRISLGLVRRGSAQERAMRQIEAAAARSASAIVTLAASAVDVLADRHGDGVRSRTYVIPTCVDTNRYQASAMPPDDPTVMMLSGTLNRLYDVPASIRLAQAMGQRRPTVLAVLSPGETPWDDLLTGSGAQLGHARPHEVPAHLARAHAGLCLLADHSVALKGAVPTKVAEFLATGRPVVATAGLGDLDSQLVDAGAGVVLTDTSDRALRSAVDLLAELVDDPATPDRCRRLALGCFDLDEGVKRLTGVYEAAAGRP